MSAEHNVVEFPNIPGISEEHAQRIMMEARRLANLAPGEWRLWFTKIAEQLGTTPDALAELVEALIADREQKAREKRAEQKLQEARAERQRKIEAQQFREKARSEDVAAKKAKAKSKAFADIIELPVDQQDAKIAALATELGEDAAALATEFAEYRAAETVTETKAYLLPDWAIDPWTDPVTTAEVLGELIDRINRHIIAKPHQVLVIALWIMFAWTREIAVHAPNLVATAPEAGCGKTTLVRVIGRLTPRPYMVGNASPASVFHIIDREDPTLIMDNCDRAFSLNPELADIFMQGYTRGFPVPRLVGHSIHAFKVFGPKACSLIGTKLPEALLTRCLLIDLWPALPEEVPEQLSEFDLEQIEKFATLRRKLARWAKDNMEALKGAKPAVPEAFVNRSVDNWSALWAISDLAGDEWGKLARSAAERLADAELTEPSWLKRLLEEFCVIFVKEDRDWITSSELIKQLTNDPISPWNNYRGGRVTQWQIPVLLKPLGIKPVLVGPRRVGGYRRKEFLEKEIFARFLGRRSLSLSPTSDGKKKPGKRK
jgi:putative DNA primase/helicase